MVGNGDNSNDLAFLLSTTSAVGEVNIACVTAKRDRQQRQKTA